MAIGSYVDNTSLYIEISVRDASAAEVSQITTPSSSHGLVVEVTNGSQICRDVTTICEIPSNAPHLSFSAKSTGHSWTEAFVRVGWNIPAGSRCPLDAKKAMADERLQLVKVEYKDTGTSGLKTWTPANPPELQIKLK